MICFANPSHKMLMRLDIDMDLAGATGTEKPNFTDLMGSWTGALPTSAGDTHISCEHQHYHFGILFARDDLFPQRSINTQSLRQCGFRLIFTLDHSPRMVQEESRASGQKEHCCASDESTDLNCTSAGKRGRQKPAQRASQNSSNR